MELTRRAKIVLDALTALVQQPPSVLVERALIAYVSTFPLEERHALELLINRAVGRSAGPQSVEGSNEGQPRAIYSFSRLCFKRDEIEPLAFTDQFRIDTPEGSFEMSKAEFYRDFSNVVASKAYTQGGIYHYPKTPSRADRYRVSPQIKETEGESVPG